VRRIRKWVNAGVLEDGKLIQGEVGSPQGARFSPLAATIYLSYVFARWGHQWRQRDAQGDVRITRSVDASVVGFEKRQEAEQVLTALPQRFAGFGLEWHPIKTRLIECGRFARQRRQERGLGNPQPFNFLGFTHLCGLSRHGTFRIERRTRAQRFRAKRGEVKAERRRRRRRHQPVPQQGAWLRSVWLGHYR
jgi:hypothetical protein